MSADDYTTGITHGYLSGYEAGWLAGYSDRGDEYTAALAGVVPVWQKPRQAELERERTVDHNPCPSRCQRCSRCIHSLAYWSRGGVDYQGAAS